MSRQLLDQAKQLNIEEPLALVEALWDSIARNAAIPLTPARETELDRRLAEHMANPDNVHPWAAVKAVALLQFDEWHREP